MSTIPDTPENPDTPEDGQAAGPDLGHLLADVDALEGAQEAAQARTAQEQALSDVQQIAGELFGALEMLRMMAAPAMAWWPQFGQVWSDQTLQGIAHGGAAVMQRHGWTMGEAWAHLGPYIALIGATVPPALATWGAIKARREALASQARPVPTQPEPVAQQGERVR